MALINFEEALDQRKKAKVYYFEDDIWDDKIFDFKNMVFEGTSKLENFQLKSLMKAVFEIVGSKELKIKEREIDEAFEASAKVMSRKYKSHYSLPKEQYKLMKEMLGF